MTEVNETSGAGALTVRHSGWGVAFADLNNDGGLITTEGQLSLQHLRDLSNRNGKISSSQSIDLNTRSFDNSGGKLISNNVLNVNAGAIALYACARRGL